MSSTPASKSATSGSAKDPKCYPSQVSTLSATRKSEVCRDDASDSCISDQSQVCMLAPSTLQQATQVLSRDFAEPFCKEAAQLLTGSSSAQHRLALPMRKNPTSCYVAAIFECGVDRPEPRCRMPVYEGRPSRRSARRQEDQSICTGWMHQGQAFSSRLYASTCNNLLGGGRYGNPPGLLHQVESKPFLRGMCCMLAPA